MTKSTVKDEKGNKCIHGHMYTNCVFCMKPDILKRKDKTTATDVKNAIYDCIGMKEPSPQKCCDKCHDVDTEHTYPAHTITEFCRDSDCECHQSPENENGWEEEFNKKWNKKNHNIKLKSFIKSPIASEKKRLLQEIEEKRDKKNTLTLKPHDYIELRVGLLIQNRTDDKTFELDLPYTIEVTSSQEK